MVLGTNSLALYSMYLNILTIYNISILSYYILIFLTAINIATSLASVILYNISASYYVNAGVQFTDLYYDMNDNGITITCKKPFYLGIFTSFIITIFILLLTSSNIMTMTHFWAITYPYLARSLILIILAFDMIFVLEHLSALKKYLNQLYTLAPTESDSLEMAYDILENTMKFYEKIYSLVYECNRLYGYAIFINITSNSIEIAMIIMALFVGEFDKSSMYIIFLTAYIGGFFLYLLLFYYTDYIKVTVS